MTPIALVAVTTLSSGLPAVTGPVHWVRGPLYLLLHHDDLVLVLHTAASVTVLTAARVVLRAETLELDFNFVLWVAPVASSAAAPTDHHLSCPATAPTHHHLSCPTACPAAWIPLDTTSTSHILRFTTGLQPSAGQSVDLVLSRFPAGTVVSVPPLLPSLSVTPVSPAVTLISLPVRLVPVRLVAPVWPVAVVLGFTFCPPSLSVSCGVTLSPRPAMMILQLLVMLLLLLLLLVMLLLMSECWKCWVGVSRIPTMIESRTSQIQSRGQLSAAVSNQSNLCKQEKRVRVTVLSMSWDTHCEYRLVADPLAGPLSLLRLAIWFIWAAARLLSRDFCLGSRPSPGARPLQLLQCCTSNKVCLANLYVTLQRTKLTSWHAQHQTSSAQLARQYSKWEKYKRISKIVLVKSIQTSQFNRTTDRPQLYTILITNNQHESK